MYPSVLSKEKGGVGFKVRVTCSTAHQTKKESATQQAETHAPETVSTCTYVGPGPFNLYDFLAKAFRWFSHLDTKPSGRYSVAVTQVRTARETLTQAALHILRREGVAQLTLERVAKEAGFSKGGLLYHFASKDALVAALLESYIGDTDRQLQVRYETDTAPGSWARANLGVAADETVSLGGGAALLAAALTTPHLVGGARGAFGRWQREAEADGLAPGAGTLLRLSLDGWWLSCLFALAPPQGDERAAFKAVYTRCTQGGLK